MVWNHNNFSWFFTPFHVIIPPPFLLLLPWSPTSPPWNSESEYHSVHSYNRRRWRCWMRAKWHCHTVKEEEEEMKNHGKTLRYCHGSVLKITLLYSLWKWEVFKLFPSSLFVCQFPRLSVKCLFLIKKFYDFQKIFHIIFKHLKNLSFHSGPFSVCATAERLMKGKWSGEEEENEECWCDDDDDGWAG